MEDQSENVTLSVIIDIVTFILLSAFNLYVARIIKPTVRGFFCDDESIRYPRKDSTVSSTMLNIVGILLPVSLIFFMEIFYKRQNKTEYSPYRIGNYRILSVSWNIYKMLACYGSGAIFSQTLTDIGKKVIGRLRPNFLDVCRPNLLSLCPDPNNYSYIENYQCHPVDNMNPDMSRVSFPSGHSSFSFYVAVFLVLYLQKRLKTTKTTVAKPILQFSLIAIAWFVALSRVMNNKHHWSDVLAGMLLGSLIAIINTVFIHRIFDSHDYEPTDNPTNALNSNNASSHEAHAQL